MRQLQLTEEGYGSIACAALLAIGAENLIANAMNADEVVILDGCPMLCAKKIAGAQGVPAGQHLVMTELGITKGPSKSYTDDDIEKIVCCVLEGRRPEERCRKAWQKDRRKRQRMRLRVRRNLLIAIRGDRKRPTKTRSGRGQRSMPGRMAGC